MARSLAPRTAAAALALVASLAGCTAAERAEHGIATDAPALPAVCTEGPSVYRALDGQLIDTQRELDAVIALHPACVRLNVREVFDIARGALVPDAVARHDQLVEAYTRAGIQVLATVTHEVASLPPDAPRTAEGLDTYARAFTAVVDHFRDRVKAFEVYNEPNNEDAVVIDPATGQPARDENGNVRTQAKLDPPAFARLLARVYRDVRVAHRGDPCWSVYLLSGGLLAFHWAPTADRDEVTQTAADYLRATIAAGRAEPDPALNWDQIRAETGSFPVDGFGYHLYFDSEPSGTASDRLREFLDDIWSPIAALEGNDTPKRLFVTEFSWQSDDTSRGDTEQENLLRAGFSTLLSDVRVGMASWFKFQDIPGERWGLYRLPHASASECAPDQPCCLASAPFDPATCRRPATDSFVEFATVLHRQPYAAQLEWLAPPPASVRPGARFTVRARATNRGSEAWAGSEWRLGAGPGCPVSTRANGAMFTALPPGGYASGVTDARVPLADDANVTADQAYEFQWDVVAPATSGRSAVVVRMVREGTAWFGPSLVGEFAVQ